MMALPGALYLIANNFMPLYGMILAFKKLDVRKGILGSDWVGFDNFKFLFSSNTAFTIIRNTILYNVVFIILGTIIAVALAILLNEVRSKKFTKFYQIPRNSGALYSVTQTIDVYVYNALMNNHDFSMSAAAAFFQSIVGFVFIMVANGVVSKVSKNDALF